MSLKRGSWLCLLAILISMLIVMAWGMLRAPESAFDDAFITYRYADNFRNGLGLVYTPNEWVLGTTAPLYAVLLGVLSRIGAPVEWWGHWVSVSGWVVAAWAGLGQLWRRQRYVAGALAALLIALIPLAVPTLGMETSFLLAVLLLASWAWMSNRGILAPVLSALAILTRQDAVLLVSLLFIARSADAKRILWREALLSTALVLPWFIYAFLRYGAILPNSALAKINQNQLMAVGGGRSFAEQLLLHLSDGSPLVLVAVGLSVAAGLYVIAREAREWWWLPGWVLLYIATYIALNVPAFPWYFLPPLAGIILVCALGLGRLLGDCRSDQFASLVTRAGQVTMALICVAIIGFVYGRSALAASLDNQPGYMAEYRQVGAWLAANTRKSDRIATIEIGVIGRLSQRPILDTMGLVSPEMHRHLVGWVESLTYAVWQRDPDYAVALSGTAWDVITPQWWFQERFLPVATFGRATIYQRTRPAPAPGYRVSQRAEFEPGFAITGFDAPRQSLTPGEQLQIELRLDAAQSPESDCQITVHLVDAATFAYVSETKERPFGGGYSCSAWQPGDSLRIPVQIHVPHDIVSGTYRIGVGVYDIARGSHFALKSDPGAHEVQLGWLRAGDPAQPVPNRLKNNLDVRWDSGIELVSMTPEDHGLAPGELLPVTLEWQVQRTQDRDLTFFVHLIDAAGSIVAQSDRRPFDGRFPTTVWQPGEILQDTYAVQIPEDIPPGEYRIRVGFYDRTGRLPLVDGTADHFVLDRAMAVRKR